MNNQLYINTEVFKDVCSKILSAVDSTELSIVTETLELIAKDEYLYVGVTNREYFVEVKLHLTTKCDFHATVNANLFLKLISQTTTDTICLTVNENTLTVKGNGTYKLPLIFNGNELLELPKIEIYNVVSELSVSSEVLRSILTYNSKELNKGTQTNAIQKLYYVDELGAITFTTGACVNSFSLEKPIKLLLNNRIVKLFKLFKEGDVKVSLGYDKLSDEIIQTKIKFENDSVTITAALSCDDSLLAKFPVNAIRGRAFNEYPYSISLDRQALTQTINRLMLFNTSSSNSKPCGVLIFSKDSLEVLDENMTNKEAIPYTSEVLEIEDAYKMKLNLADLKATLDTCIETHINVSFGDGQALVISRGGIKNVIPQVKTNKE